ncbi:hypothetical protein SISNIDRAFT_492066 [Sistotremastrum niveocremeum HHB9708]|uniref:Uncharacterized protein n=1 Tax=Sistotremastrum niveocremeum HHB9708 TaxID=1314777 RepID=A0A164M3K4_9AGAM|nr:hypothetical protein SISNIDRAFT_492066 [Sistotremastrum niveocremeum HHB9708]
MLTLSPVRDDTKIFRLYSVQQMNLLCDLDTLHQKASISLENFEPSGPWTAGTEGNLTDNLVGVHPFKGVVNNAAMGYFTVKILDRLLAACGLDSPVPKHTQEVIVKCPMPVSEDWIDTDASVTRRRVAIAGDMDNWGSTMAYWASHQLTINVPDDVSYQDVVLINIRYLYEHGNHFLPLTKFLLASLALRFLVEHNGESDQADWNAYRTRHGLDSIASNLFPKDLGQFLKPLFVAVAYSPTIFFKRQALTDNTISNLDLLKELVFPSRVASSNRIAVEKSLFKIIAEYALNPNDDVFKSWKIYIHKQLQEIGQAIDEPDQPITYVWASSAQTF